MLKEVLEIPTSDPAIVLRQLTLESEDVQLHAAVSEHPEYTDNFDNTLYSSAFPTIEKVRDMRLNATHPYRMGIWKGKELAGYIGLARSKDLKEATIGYFVRQDFRGNSYATVSLKALADYIAPQFDTIKLDTHPDNIASMRVAEKAGFEFVGETDVDWGNGPLRANEYEYKK